MQRLAMCLLRNLFAATEAVSDYEDVVSGLAHRRQKHALACRHRNLILPFFKTKGTSHATAAGRQYLKIEAGLL